jgi:hypothetical protein
MKHLLFLLSALFVFNGFACLNTPAPILTYTATSANLNLQNEQIVEDDGIADSVEKPKKKKVIKGLIYYLGGGFVLLVIGMVFFIRKKPKTP